MAKGPSNPAASNEAATGTETVTETVVQNAGTSGNAFPSIEQADQLKALSAAENGGLFMSQDEGMSIVAAGWAGVDTNNVDAEGKAFVTLTEAGKALVNHVSAPRQTSFVVRKDIPLPTANRRGRTGSGYPIESMEVGDSFHVAKTVDNPDPSARIASSISNARIKFSEEIPNEFETVTVRTYKKDADGKRIKDADGHWIVDSTKTETRPKTKLLRDWTVATVDKSDPEGVGARVWRTM